MLWHPVKLIASSGASFAGRSSLPFAVPIRAIAAPCVSHSGHVEVASDPSHRGQIVVLAHPVAGASDGEPQSSRAWLSAMVAATFAPASRLLELLAASGVPAVEVFDHAALVAERAAWIAVGSTASAWNGLPDFELDSAVETSASAEVEFGSGPLVVLADFGCKRGLISDLVDRGLRVRCVPPSCLESALSEARAVVLSSGPGNPSDFAAIAPLIARVQLDLPVLGVCLGHQLLGIANGCGIERLARGHHGPNRAAISAAGGVSITSHNHAFSLAQIGTRVEVTHTDAADGSVEGIRALRARWAVGVQFHPEGRPGPRAPAVLDEFAAAAKGGVSACR